MCKSSRFCPHWGLNWHLIQLNLLKWILAKRHGESYSSNFYLWKNLYLPFAMCPNFLNRRNRSWIVPNFWYEVDSTPVRAYTRTCRKRKNKFWQMGTPCPGSPAMLWNGRRNKVTQKVNHIFSNFVTSAKPPKKKITAKKYISHPPPALKSAKLMYRESGFGIYIYMYI